MGRIGDAAKAALSRLRQSNAGDDSGNDEPALGAEAFPGSGNFSEPSAEYSDRGKIAPYEQAEPNKKITA